ncbi:hypothetical protein A6U86_26010 [Rhizobium sp. AC27/96]|nr:hypothetical protein A6U86_26010 [Rhizobium sp. AC27/96]
MEYRTIVDFRIARNLQDPTYGSNIYFEMRANDLRSDRALKYYFDGCTELKMGDLNSLWGISIEIEPCRSPFFEHTRFKVFDLDTYGEMKFLCASFAIEAS